MAAVAGFVGYVKVGPAASPTNKVSGVTDLQTPWQTAQYDTTNMDTGANNGWMQNIPGLKSGKVTIKVNTDSADTNGQIVLRNAWVNSTLLYFITSTNNVNTATFTGYVDNCTEHAPVNNKADSSFSITVTGAVAFA